MATKMNGSAHDGDAQSNGFRNLEKEIHAVTGVTHDVFALISSHPETNPTPKKKSSQPVQPWVKVQQTTFTKWVNNHIKDTGKEITDLQDDLKDGLILIHLMETLTGNDVQVRYQRNPRTRLQHLENMKIAFDFMEEEHVELVSMRPLDIVDGNLKLILGLLWTLISKYQIASTHSDVKSSSPLKSSPRRILLRWFQAVLPNHEITNFTTNWNDGTNLAALVNYCKPGLIPDHNSLDPNEHLENVTNGMNLAEEHFGIPQVILPQDLASEHPDDLSVMTYLSFFCCQGSPGQTILLQWINSVIPHHQVTNFTSNWKDGDALSALVQAFLPQAIPPSSSQEIQNPLTRVQLAMGVANDQLEIEQTLSPEQFVHPNLDQTSMMAYLTQFMFRDMLLPVSPRLSAVGPGISGGTTGTDTPFSIKGEVSSETDLTITITSPEGSVVDFDKVPSPSGDTVFQYTPEIPGTYVIDVTYSGEHIPGSPYTVTHTPPSHAESCFVSGKGVGRVCIGEVATFTVDTSNASAGKLEVEVHDTKSEELPVNIDAKEGGLYEVGFTPQEVGEHWIFVSWGLEEIPESPFTCKVVNPSACVAVGDGLSEGVLGKPSSFEVSTEGAGPGKLSATVYGPSEPVDLTQQPNDNGTYSYRYSPEQPGSYIVEIKWEGFPIPGSPFTAHPSTDTVAGSCFVKEMRSELMRVNKPVSVLVDALSAPGASLHASVCGPASEDECEVVKVEEGVYGVMFIPRVVGEYTVSILCNGAPIPDSPLDFSINDPAKCKVDAYYGSFQVDTPIAFAVSTFEAGEGELKAVVKGPNGDQACSIEEDTEGKYSVTFTPHTPGTYSTDLFFDGDPFLASPLEFKVLVNEDRCVFEAVQQQEEAPLGKLVDLYLKKEQEGKEESIIVTKPDTIEGFCLLDTVHEFRMFAPGRKPEEFSVSAMGMKTHAVPTMTLIPTGENTYNIHFMAAQTDDYTVDITYGDTHVPGSPFTLKLRPPTDPDSVQAFDPVKPFKAKGNPIQLIFDTSKAGIGSLEAIVTTSADEQLQATKEEISPDLYRVTFVPMSSGRYTATILWDGKPIKGSPFAFNYQEQIIEPVVSVSFEPEMIQKVKGHLAARCVGQNVGQVELRVQQFETGHYQLSFDPPSKDLYRLEVYWFGKEVSGSPFKIDLTDAPMTPAREDERIVRSLRIEEEDGRKGILSACVLGKRSGVVPIQVSLSLKKDRAQITFSDRLRDTFELFLFWNHRLLNGAPFKLDHNAQNTIN